MLATPREHHLAAGALADMLGSPFSQSSSQYTLDLGLNSDLSAPKVRCSLGARVEAKRFAKPFHYAALPDRCNGLGTNNCSMQLRSASGDSDLSTNASRPAAIAVSLIQGSLKEVNMTM
jgi:hypothetical protein